MNLVIGLGSNLGHRHQNLLRALSLLEDLFPKVAISSIYESSPVDYLKQNNFLNLLYEGKNSEGHDAQTILKLTQGIEQSLGREKTCPKGPRIIDLDIIFLGRTKIQEENLCIPHPSWYKRPFVTRPLREIPFGLTYESFYLSHLKPQKMLFDLPSPHFCQKWRPKPLEL